MQKNKILFAFFVFLVSTSAFSYLNNATIQRANNVAGFDVNYSPLWMHNPAFGSTAVYLDGHQLGLDLTITKTFYERIYSQLSYKTAAGNLSYQSSANLSQATQFLEQGAARVGYEFYLSNKMAFIPYLTGGYQYHQFDTGGTPSGPNFINGYTLFYQNAFYGLGLLAQWATSTCLVLSTDVQIGRTSYSWLHYNAPNTVIDAFGDKAIVYQQADVSPESYFKLGVAGDYQFTSDLHGRAGVDYAQEKFGGTYTSPSNIYQPTITSKAWTYHAGVAYALDDNSVYTTLISSTQSDAIYKANNQASLLVGMINQNYGEQVSEIPHYVDRQNGAIPYTNFMINKTFQRVYTQLSMLFAGGDTQYIGALIDSGAPYVASTRNDMLDLQAKVGYSFFPMSELGLTPYVTGGFHRWLRDINGASFRGLIISGYPETYQHAWYGVGLYTQLVATPTWVLSLDGNYGITHCPQNRSWVSFTSPNTTEIVSSLGVRNLYSIGVASDYLFLSSWHALAGVNYLRFKYGQSPANNLGIYEPYSRTMEIFYSVGIGYSLDV